MAGITDAENVAFVHATLAENLDLLKSYVHAALHDKLQPESARTRLTVYENARHEHLVHQPPAAGSASLFDSQENFNPDDAFGGMRMMLELHDLKGSASSDRDLETLRLRIDALYTDPATGVVDAVKKDNEQQVVLIITNQTNPDLVHKLRDMLTDGSNSLCTADLASKYIKRWNLGANTFKPSTSHEAMVADLVNMRIDELENRLTDQAMWADDSDPDMDDSEMAAAARELACTQCGAMGKHPTALCNKMPCLMENCKRGAGQGHTPACIRYKGWMAAKQAARGKQPATKSDIRKGGGRGRGRFQRKPASRDGANTVSDSIVSLQV